MAMELAQSSDIWYRSVFVLGCLHFKYTVCAVGAAPFGECWFDCSGCFGIPVLYKEFAFEIEKLRKFELLYRPMFVPSIRRNLNQVSVYC